MKALPQAYLMKLEGAYARLTEIPDLLLHDQRDEAFLEALGKLQLAAAALTEVLMELIKAPAEVLESGSLSRALGNSAPAGEIDPDEEDEEEEAEAESEAAPGGPLTGQVPDTRVRRI